MRAAIVALILTAAGCTEALPNPSEASICTVELEEPSTASLAFTARGGGCTRPLAAPAIFEASAVLPDGVIAFELHRRFVGAVVDVDTTGILVTYKEHGVETCRAWRGALLFERDDAEAFSLDFGLTCETPGRTDLSLWGSFHGTPTN